MIYLYLIAYEDCFVNIETEVVCIVEIISYISTVLNPNNKKIVRDFVPFPLILSH